MVVKFKDKLKGERLVLRRTRPTISISEVMFDVIDRNREHLKPWFVWEKQTLKVEDSLRYLFDKEEKTKKGKEIEYGIYLGNTYMGNISMFHIDYEKRSGEIGYWLSSAFVRNGYMTEAVKILEKEFFGRFSLNRIQIKCDERNTASIGVAKKCGYKLEGKHREDAFSEYFNSFRNTLVFSKLKSEYRES